MNKIFLLLEIPLALLSFLFYKIMKFVIGNLYTIYLSIDKKKASRWRVISSELIESPLSLPVLMTKGPRWNTHAIIGTLGPFAVKDYIELDVISANKSARSWIAIFYSFPGYQTIDTIASDSLKSEIQWQKLPLKTGQYTIALRYYEREDFINLPAIKIDGKDFVAPQTVPNKINDFYLNLSEKTNWFYLSLHYYIFTILKLRKFLPESFVNYEFLPVGATDTNFIYNFLDKNQSLNITTKSSILDNYNIHYTSYNRASFPLHYFQIDREEKVIEASDRQGFYLLRLRPKSGSSESTGDKSIDWKISDENRECQKLNIG
jgi:Family of unknown function (DUF6208)